MLVREARPEEFAAVAALTVRAYVEGGFTAPDSPYVDVLADVAGRAAAAEVYVAVDGRDELLGAVTFARPGSPYAQTTAPDEAEFRMLAVDPAARGRGVGEALVRRCVERATALGCRTLRLSTQSDMAAAQRLYRRLGFRRTPERDWQPRPGIDLLTYELGLPA